MDPLRLVALLLDITLVLVSIGAFIARPRIGGQLAHGMRILVLGVVVLGLAHLIETIFFIVFNVDEMTNEVIHRLLVGAGLLLVVLGFFRMRRAFEERG